jgi:hypothetical protein
MQNFIKPNGFIELLYRRHIIRVLFLSMINLCVFLSVTSAQEIGSKRLNLDLKGVSLKTAFSAIQKQSGVRFIYDEDVNKYANVKIDLSEKNLPLKEALESILGKTNLRFEFSEGYVIISEGKVRNEQPRQTRNSLSGKVIDVTTGQAIAGATVRIDQDAKVTVSDNNGSYGAFPWRPYDRGLLYRSSPASVPGNHRYRQGGLSGYPFGRSLEPVIE